MSSTTKEKKKLKDHKPVDIWMVTYQRKELTENAINYLNARTHYPYRLFVVDNHSTDGTIDFLKQAKKDGRVFFYLQTSHNVGIHMAHNIGLSLVDSEYCISTDNDIYVPDLMGRDRKCWLQQLVEIMDNKKNRIYGAVACQPHVFLGTSDPKKTGKDVLEVGHCGAVMRIMRTDVVKKVQGWDNRYDANRNHEEKTICSRIQSVAKGKVGYAANIRCYHDFGDDNNWGYKNIHPHDHGHRIPGLSKWATDPTKQGEIWPTPEKFKEQEEQFDTRTWERKV
jgi:GT2 family glycosyltransferase